MLKIYFSILVVILIAIPQKSNSQSWSKFGWPSDSSLVDEIYFDSTNNVSYLVVGKRYQGNSMNYIMKWDGANFTPMGDGFNGPLGSVAIYHDTVFVCGVFDSSGTTFFNFPFAKWNGSNWQQVEPSFSAHDNAAPNQPPILNTLKVYQNKLYIGGEFVSNNNPQLGGLAYWDGISIKAGYCIGSGAVTNYDMKLVLFKNEMYFLSDYCGDICAQRNVPYGTYDGIVKYDTICNASMVAYPTPFPIGVSAIYATDSLLYIGHYSSIPEGNCISAFDGVNLIPLEQGLNAPVYSINSYDGYIIVGGVFTATFDNSIQLPHIARWDGISWSQFPSNCELNGNVIRLNRLDNYLLASGNFHDCSLDTNINWSAIYPASINTAIEEIETNSFVLYPNPTSSTLNFSFTNPNEIANITAYNLIGEEVLYTTNWQNNSIDVSTLSNGVYIFSLTTNDKIAYRKKVIVNR